MAQQKVSFKKWWKNITGTKTAKVGLFHIDLVDSIEYAGVPVNYTANGKTRCQGYIPTIVSKCGWLLKEQATKTRGIFRVSGSAKRVSELQLIFDTPPTYGSQLDWTGFTIHDASNVLRRYLNYLPDPVITLEYYEKFRDVYKNVTDDTKKIAAYQELISKLPPPHSCLLMYLLDLLSLFAHHSDENLMDSKNLASVFQPGVLSHPSHAMSPGEYMTSAAVLKFLIDNQSSFTLPQPNIDDDDEEMVNFGLAGAQPSRPGPMTFKSSHYHGGFVNAADHEKLYEQPGFEDELDTGIKRQLSLHKPISEHATLPGNTINRSKSTNSSISSRHSQSGKISSNFLAQRRSNRGSKSSPKVYTEHDPHGSEDTKENDLSEISEDPGATDENSLTPRSSVIRKATTSPVIGSDDPNSELTIRRKQLKSEGLHREPSIFCETIEIPFPAPTGSSGNEPFRPSSALAPNIPRGGSQFAPPNRFASEPQLQYSPSATKAVSPPTSSGHIDPSVPRQQDNSYVSPPTTAKIGLGVKRSSATTRKDPAQRPDHSMTIQRAKSNPGDLVSISARNQSHQMSASHTGNHTYEMFKGWISGKNKDHDSTTKEKEKDKAKSEKKRDSLTEKQRKYKSQEVPPGHHQTGSGSGFRGPIHETISEHEYQRPPPNTPPQRPPPPPPEGSLMDMLDPPQRLGYHSDHSSPTGSRSVSPSRAPPSSAHYPHSANPSITSPSSRSTATSHSDRLYHGRGQQQSTSEGVYYDQQHLAPSALHYRQQSNSSFGHESEHGSQHSNSNSNSNSRHNSFEALPIPIPVRSASRTRQGSFGSTHHDQGDNSNMALSPPPKSRDRRTSPRPGSSSPLQKPPARAQSSSRNPSPAPNSSSSTPSLGPSASSSFGHHHHYHPHHGSSPLAEGQSNVGVLHSSPSSRARSRAQSQSRDDSTSSSHSHNHSHNNQSMRERSRSVARVDVSTSTSDSPGSSPALGSTYTFGGQAMATSPSPPPKNGSRTSASYTSGPK